MDQLKEKHLVKSLDYLKENLLVHVLVQKKDWMTVKS